MIDKKILLYQGGRYFGIEKTYKAFQNILDEYTVDNYETVEIFSTIEFFEYSTIIFFSQNGNFTINQEKNILEYVSSGKGFLGLHGASASFKSHPKYFEMLGGRFIGHKEPQRFDIKVIDPNHPITSGIVDFSFRDEPYRHDLSMGKDINTLAEADYHDMEDPNPEPIIWAKSYGDGRVFYCALGHRNASLKDEIFKTIIKSAVNWAIRDEK